MIIPFAFHSAFCLLAVAFALVNFCHVYAWSLGVHTVNLQTLLWKPSYIGVFAFTTYSCFRAEQFWYTSFGVLLFVRLTLPLLERSLNLWSAQTVFGKIRGVMCATWTCTISLGLVIWCTTLREEVDHEALGVLEALAFYTFFECVASMILVRKAVLQDVDCEDLNPERELMVRIPTMIASFYLLPVLWQVPVHVQLFHLWVANQCIEAIGVYLALEEVLSRLPTVQVKSPVECTICLDQCSQGKQLPCQHVMHASCLRRWLQKNTVCPICGKPILPAQREEPAEMQPLAQHEHYVLPPPAVAAAVASHSVGSGHDLKPSRVPESAAPASPELVTLPEQKKKRATKTDTKKRGRLEAEDNSKKHRAELESQ